MPEYFFKTKKISVHLRNLENTSIIISKFSGDSLMDNNKLLQKFDHLLKNFNVLDFILYSTTKIFEKSEKILGYSSSVEKSYVIIPNLYGDLLSSHKFLKKQSIIFFKSFNRFLSIFLFNLKNCQINLKKFHEPHQIL